MVATIYLFLIKLNSKMWHICQYLRLLFSMMIFLYNACTDFYNVPHSACFLIRDYCNVIRIMIQDLNRELARISMYYPRQFIVILPIFFIYRDYCMELFTVLLLAIN